ncbi:MAG: lytic transglycosylase domain-containing protein [Candidatus Yonathbacteria bacterium]|nr:lytic transglycosylase domain-containing protein [Candidatus Yonathbacteria bacterium]
MKISSAYISFFWIFLFCGLALPVYAQDGGTPYILLEPSVVGGQESMNASDYFSNIYTVAIASAGVLAVLMFAIGGIQYMFSGAGGAKSNGRTKMVNAVFGIILALAAWLILNTINADLVDLNVNLPDALVQGISPGGGPAEVPEGTPEPAPADLPNNLPRGCSNYVTAFRNAASASGVSGCLLYGIASQESGCNPGLTSPKGACGMMQFLPSTAGISCAALRADPVRSINLAARYLNSSRNTLSSRYGGTFSIGSSYTQSRTDVTIGRYTYNTGNDDLIASYNAGAGASSGGRKGPFAASSSCASRDGTIPVWQCDINTPGYAETRNYVRRVQEFQRQCESAGVLR